MPNIHGDGNNIRHRNHTASNSSTDSEDSVRSSRRRAHHRHTQAGSSAGHARQATQEAATRQLFREANDRIPPETGELQGQLTRRARNLRNNYALTGATMGGMALAAYSGARNVPPSHAVGLTALGVMTGYNLARSTEHILPGANEIVRHDDTADASTLRKQVRATLQNIADNKSNPAEKLTPNRMDIDMQNKKDAILGAIVSTLKTGNAPSSGTEHLSASNSWAKHIAETAEMISGADDGSITASDVAKYFNKHIRGESRRP